MNVNSMGQTNLLRLEPRKIKLYSEDPGHLRPICKGQALSDRCAFLPCPTPNCTNVMYSTVLVARANAAGATTKEFRSSSPPAKGSLHSTGPDKHKKNGRKKKEQACLLVKGLSKKGASVLPLGRVKESEKKKTREGAIGYHFHIPPNQHVLPKKDGSTKARTHFRRWRRRDRR